MTALRKSPIRDGYAGFAEVVVSVSHFGKVAGLKQAVGRERLHAGPGAPGVHPVAGRRVARVLRSARVAIG